jgi:hypothetical protein
VGFPSSVVCQIFSVWLMASVLVSDGLLENTQIVTITIRVERGVDFLPNRHTGFLSHRCDVIGK